MKLNAEDTETGAANGAASTTPKADKAKKVKTKEKSSKPAKKDVKAKTKEKAGKKPAASKAPVERDQFGFRKGSKKSEAAAMYASKKGATLGEVKTKTGSSQLNLLTELESKGVKVTKNKEKGSGKKQVTRYKIVIPEGGIKLKAAKPKAETKPAKEKTDKKPVKADAKSKSKKPAKPAKKAGKAEGESATA